MTHSENIETSLGRVLVVEDEKSLAQMVSIYLGRTGFDVTQVHTGVQALSVAREWEPDVVLLDLGLPGADGIEVCRSIRSFSECYVLIVTARGSEDDKLVGLAAGADDYITKPFSVRELVARVQAVLRRPRTGDMTRGQGSRQFLNLAIDLAAHEVRCDGFRVSLTRTEFDLLVILSARPHKAWSRRELLDAVWDPSWVGDERVVDVHIGHLRHKLKAAAQGTDFVETVRGVGYRMVAL